MKGNLGKPEKISHMNKIVELYPDFDFHYEEWESWGYDCWLVVLDDYMIVALFHYCTVFLKYQSMFFSFLSIGIYLKQSYG